MSRYRDVDLDLLAEKKSILRELRRPRIPVKDICREDEECITKPK